MKYYPEGYLLNTGKNKKAISSIASLTAAMEAREIVEGTALMCDAEHNLIVSVGAYRGIIPRNQAALGIEEGQTREIAIISRVGKPVCFHIIGVNPNDGSEHTLLLSRKSAQQEALSEIMRSASPGNVIQGRVTHLEQFGAFVDIGCGNIALVGIENISVSRISHPNNRLQPGQDILAAILYIDYTRDRLCLTQRELLGTWEENASRFSTGQTVSGIVRGVLDYGIFVELSPNLSGLAEFREGISEGMRVSVFIKSITPEKMKIKLIIIDAFEVVPDAILQASDYFITDGRLSTWTYSPSCCCVKRVETVF